jgi:hypothetical protein
VRDDERPEVYVAAALCAALVEDPRVHEQGITVTLVASRRCIVLEGAVVSAERREEIARVVRELVPDFEVRNDVTVQSLGTEPDEEVLL